MNHIILIGFMGSGKTSVGKQLAKVMQLPFVDMDQLIVEKTGMEITEIFERYGEAHFRRIESECLEELSKEEERRVISVGGGLPVQPRNQPYLRKMGTVVLLEASVQTLQRRLKYDSSRPMLKGKDLQKNIETLQRQRKAEYEKVSDIRVVTDDKEFCQIVDEIRKIVDCVKN
ncbi:shikimate kinase [Ruminococcus sp. OA3]|uniref:shikimate kinase n=1 Tax=Ruminococcus sp. OA3 TaxID=2914164 RepID=UPI001F057C6C|nr:shikimate kinase [Ruminococcus sp. OA3]MCH1982342.1 shikimate kinase [Ruminococcus sp. OA3]